MNTDEEKVKQFIESRGVTRCDPSGYRDYVSTAKGHSTPENEWKRRQHPVREDRIGWAKLLVMFQDLGGWPYGTTKSNQKSTRDRACYFFFNPKSELQEWCDMVGLDAEYVRDRARKILENGMPQTRAKPGKGVRYEERKQWRERNKNGKVSKASRETIPTV